MLRYDPESGLLYWRVKAGRMRAGSVAGCVKGDRGYIVVRLGGGMRYAHRIVWVLMNGRDLPPGAEIDHIDGNPSNNKWSNLRLATAQQNKRNMRRPDSNTSGVKGVTFRRNRGQWQAQMSVDNRCVYLGSFERFEDAVNARRAAEQKHFGEFARIER